MSSSFRVIDDETNAEVAVVLGDTVDRVIRLKHDEELLAHFRAAEPEAMFVPLEKEHKVRPGMLYGKEGFEKPEDFWFRTKNNHDDFAPDATAPDGKLYLFSAENKAFIEVDEEIARAYLTQKR